MQRLCVSATVIGVALVVLLACGGSTDEFRGFWVDTWGNGILSQSQVNKLLGVVGDPNSKGDIRNANCNAVIVEVRRRADVCYPSGVGEPYFSGLSPANFNALQAVIDAAHDTTGGKQRVEVHCWLVTFACAGGGYTSPTFLAHDDPADPENYWATEDENGAWTDDRAFDPGHPKCEEYLTNVCMDLVNNFDIDGIHYDYIRFTANNQGYNPTSVARYNTRYGLSGKPSSSNEQWKQWRRDQVTALVRRVYAKIQASKPNVKVSGSFVTWNPSPTSSTREGFEATRPYYDVYSDWDSWMEEGIVDMAVPMTYYNWASLPSDYTKWMNFEKDRKFNRHMVIGPGIYLNSLSNAIYELQMTRYASPAGNYAQGFSGYSYRSPYKRTDGSYGTWEEFAPTFTSQVCPTPTNIPEMPWKTNPTKGHISGTVTFGPDNAWADGAYITLTGPESRTQYCDGTGFYAFIDLTPGAYTVTAYKTGYPTAQRSVQVQIGQVTGNMYVLDMALGNTTNPPAIANVGASNVTTTSATIGWTTDQASSSRVEYGTTTGYGSMTPLDSSPVTSHSVGLTGLSPKTLYHFRVISANGNGQSTSGDFTFMTSGPPTISGVQAISVTSTSATITWTTDVSANSQVNYGTTTSYGGQASDGSLVTSHSLTLSGLLPSTTYHYQCASANPYGSAQSGDFTFTTQVATADVLIDNLDAGWSNTSPNGNTWSVGTLSNVPKIGTDYLYSAGDGSTVESSNTRKCRWTPNLPSPGYYDVYVYYQRGTNRNSAAPFTVHYRGGSVTSIQNQYSTSSNTSGWYLVGQNLPFLAGTSGYVEVTTLTMDTKLVSADAAKWVYVGALDVTPPSVTVQQAIGQDDPSYRAPIGFTVVFSEPVTGFTASDVVVTGTASGTKTVTIAGSGATYTVWVSGMTSSGTVIVTIPAGVAQDEAGNGNTASTGANNSVSYVYDVTAPVMGAVTDEVYTTSTSSLRASWSATEPESGIQYYEYAVGTTPGGADVRGWTSSGTNTSLTIDGLSLSVGAKYYVSARATNNAGIGSPAATSNGVTVAQPVACVAEAKALGNGTAIALPACGVSAVFDGAFYVQDASRVSGIRVESAEPVSVNQQVQVCGVLGTHNTSERVLTQCKVVPGSAGPVIRALGISTRSAGGERLNEFTPGVTGGVGPYNIGLLVRVAGKVRAVVSDGFYVDDGCGLSDGSGSIGLKVWTGAPDSATIDATVTVTGVVSCRPGAGGSVYPLILARDVAGM